MSATERSGIPAGSGSKLTGTPPKTLRIARALMRPIERFLAIEAASGIVLLLAAAVAMAWANSPWGQGYHALWDTPLTVSAGLIDIGPTLHFVVNDVLMTAFFLVVGLEIRRELRSGEIADPRRAALPAIAALGGMLVPASIYALAVPAGDEARGWGVPMATDIAFALGVLALLGRRVPSGLRVLLLALAIIDDIGAIVVIAVFYSSGMNPSGLAIAAAGLGLLLLLPRLGVRTVTPLLLPAAVLWYGVLRAGIHPTIAGVITGLLIPGREESGRQGGSAARRLETALHPWVAFAIMPLFALANAGVDLGSVNVGAAPGVALGIFGGLVVGKLVGVVTFSLLAVRFGIAAMPRDVSLAGLIVLGLVASIGFTMALFVAGLAFSHRPDLYGIAQLGVFAGSLVGAVAALIVGRMLLPASAGVAVPAGAGGTVSSGSETEES